MLANNARCIYPVARFDLDLFIQANSQSKVIFCNDLQKKINASSHFNKTFEVFFLVFFLHSFSSNLPHSTFQFSFFFTSNRHLLRMRPPPNAPMTMTMTQPPLLSWTMSYPFNPFKFHQPNKLPLEIITTKKVNPAQDKYSINNTFSYITSKIIIIDFFEEKPSNKSNNNKGINIIIDIFNFR